MRFLSILQVLKTIFDMTAKIQTASKFEGRADNRSYDDKKRLFDGVGIPSIV